MATNSDKELFSVEEYLDNRSTNEVTDIAEKAMENIFENCDPENTGYAAVSVLIEFMSPYMQDDLEALEILKILLDPIGIDQKVSKEKFCTVMSKWSQDQWKLKNSNTELETSPSSKAGSEDQGSGAPLFEEDLNLSNRSTYSCGSTPSPLVDSSFERQSEIENLKLQIKKFLEETASLRCQLTTSEECNTNLQQDISKITRKLEKKIEMEQKITKELEELQEVNSIQKKEIENLQGKNSELKSENMQLKRNNQQLNEEKERLIEDIELCKEKNEESTELLSEARYNIIKLEEELLEKEASLQKCQEQCNHFQEKIKFLENTIMFMRAEKKNHHCSGTSTVSRKKNGDDSSFNGTLNQNNVNNKSTKVPTNSSKTPTTPKERRNDHVDVSTCYNYLISPSHLSYCNSPFKIIDSPLKSLIANPVSPISIGNETSQLHLKRLYSIVSSTPTLLPRNLSSPDLLSPACTSYTFNTADSLSNVDLQVTTHTSYESAHGSSSDDSKLYSIIVNDHVPVKSSLMSELKQATSENRDEDHIQCSNKLKDLEGKLSNLEQEYDDNVKILKTQELTIKKFENQTKELESTILLLRENLTKATLQFEKENTEKNSQIRHLQDEINTLVSAKDTLLYEKSILIQEKTAQEDKIKLLIESYELERIQLQDILKSVQFSTTTNVKENPEEESNDIKIKLECITDNVKRITENYEKLKLDNNTLKNSYQLCLGENSEYKENIKRLELKVSNLEKKVQNKKQKITNLKKEIIEKSLQINDFKDDIIIKDKNIIDLKSDKLSVEKELERIRSEYNSQEEQLLTLKVQLKSTENELEKQTQLLSKYKKGTEESQNNTQLELLTERTKKLLDIELEHQLCSKYKTALKNKTEKIKSLLIENKRLKTRSIKLRIKLSSSENQNTKLKEKILSLENSLENSEKSMKEICVKYEKSEKQLDILKIEYNDLKMQKQKLNDSRKQFLNDSNEIKSDEYQKIVQLESELNSYKIKYNNLEQDLIKLQAEFDDIVNDSRSKSRCKNDKSKNKVKLISERKIEKLEGELENESIKNEELSSELDKISNEKSLLQLEIIKTEKVFQEENNQLKEKITKLKSYLYETSSYLNDITKETMNKIFEKKYYLPTGWEDYCDVIKLQKERYYEPLYVNFHRNLCQCIYLLIFLVKNCIKRSSFDDFYDVSGQEDDGNFHLNISEDERKLKTINLQPTKLYVHQSAPPSPKLKSKFVYRIPDKSGRLILSQNMAETYPIKRVEHSKQNHRNAVSSLELNNNVTPDRKQIYQQSFKSNQKATELKDDDVDTVSNTNEVFSDSNVAVINVADVVSSPKDLTESKDNSTDLSDAVRRFSNMSISASSTNSGSTESLSIDNEQCTLTDDLRNNLKAALDAVLANKSTNNENSNYPQPTTVNERPYTTNNVIHYDRSRSQSLNNSEEIDVFPTISDTFLENLNLNPKTEEESPKEEICEQDEIEKKFVALSLAFHTDATTLVTRKEQLQKYRVQAERNFQFEVERLTQGVHRLNPLCIDAERTELVSSLLSQIDILLEAARHASVSAQCFGAVHQEWRLNESIKLMLRYVENVKLQRDTARRHFQYTRRMLQESTSSDIVKSTSQQKTSPSSSVNPNSNNSNNRLMTRRRASIATISRPTANVENLRSIANRRQSPSHAADIVPRRLESLDRLNILSVRSARQSKAELSTEHLQNIHENMEAESSDISDNETEQLSKSISEKSVLESSEIDEIRHKLGLTICNFFRRNFGDNLHTSGLLHEICITCSLIFFFIATVQLACVLMEIQYAKQGISVTYASWNTWEEIVRMLFPNSIQNSGPKPT